MSKPDLTRRRFVDRFYFAVDGRTTGAFCGLEWQPLPDGRLLVIAYEHPDSHGRSVTNAAEEICQQFAAEAGIDVDRMVWLESYAAERPKETPVFDRCTFTQGAGGKLSPAWSRMKPEDWRAIGARPPAVPRFNRSQL